LYQTEKKRKQSKRFIYPFEKRIINNPNNEIEYMHNQITTNANTHLYGCSVKTVGGYRGEEKTDDETPDDQDTNNMDGMS